MLYALKFVQGAVAKKDFVPELTHYLIRDKRITGYNGRIALSCKIETDLDLAPKAQPFIKAIERCQDTVKMHVTPTGKISIKSGKKRFLIDQMEENVFPEISPPESKMIDLPEGSFIGVLKELMPFIAEDASRPWAKGILFRNGFAHATNNIILVQKWLGFTLPFEINFPQHAIRELMRIKRDPVRIQLSESTARFWFDDDTWMQTNLYATEWPDMDTLLNTYAASPTGNGVKLDDVTLQAAEDLVPFANELDAIHIRNGCLCTSAIDDEGAQIEVGDLGIEGACFNVKQFIKLHSIANEVDFTTFPKPCGFFGDSLRGVFIGMRV